MSLFKTISFLFFNGCEIILAHRKVKDASKNSFFSLDNLPFKQINNPVAIENDGVLLKDGSLQPADVVLFATGYHFDYKFLDLSGNEFSYSNKQVTPLFQHLLHCDFLDSLAFLAVNNKVVPFPLMDQQMRYLMYCWFDKKILPSENEIKEFFIGLQKSNEGRPTHYLHELSGNRQWEYLDELDKLMDGTNLNFVVEQRKLCRKLYDERCKRAKLDPQGYKSTIFEI